MMQNANDASRDNDGGGPPTDPMELREVIEREIEVLGPHCDLNHIDVSQMTSLADVFFRSDFNGDISLWDTSGVTSLENTFAGSQFNGDISKWDTSSATCMTRMFDRSEFNGDISGWNTSKVTDMARMFSNSKFKGDVSRWDVSNVENMVLMFEFCRIACDLSAWDVSKVKSMFRMFVGSTFNGDISDWNVASCENFGHMFLASKFTGDLSRWSLLDTAQVPSVVEDEHLALFKEPNFYHWCVLSSKRADSIAGMPAAWKEHGAAARAIGVDMGMPDHEIWHWAQRTWNDKKGMHLALPEGLVPAPSLS